jgi:hypothetical protein
MVAVEWTLNLAGRQHGEVVAELLGSDVDPIWPRLEVYLPFSSTSSNSISSRFMIGFDICSTFILLAEYVYQARRLRCA